MNAKTTTTKMQKVASVTFRVLTILAIFGFGLLMGQHLHPDEPKELAVAGIFPVLTLDMVSAKAIVYVEPKGPIYVCAKEVAHKIAGKYFAERIMHQPSKIWLASRDMTRLKCGRAITILIDVPELKTER
jgi:hypothetical protein